MKKGRKRKRSLFLQDNIRLICLSYGFMGFNFLIASAKAPNDTAAGIFVLLGLVMLAMIAVSLFDKRKDVRDKGYAIVCCIMHLFAAVFISFLLPAWWVMIIYAIELLIYIFILKNQAI